jgi:hypothetical protein
MTATISSTQPTVSALRIAYLSLSLAASLAIAWWGPDTLERSLVAVVAAWVLLSLLGPGWRTGGGSLVGMLIVVLFLQNYPVLDLGARFWAIVSLVLTAVALHLLPLARTPFFPFLHLYLVMQGAYLTVAVLVAETPDPYRDIFSPDIRSSGFQLFALFTAILTTAGVLSARALWHRAETSRQPSGDIVRGVAVPRAYALMAASLVFDLVVRITGLTPALGTLPTIARLVGFGGAALLCLLWIRGNLAPIHRMVVVLATGALMLAGIGTGLLYQAALPGLVLFALIIAERRRVPWLLLLTATVLMVVLNVSKSQFRQEQREGVLAGSTTELGVVYLDRVIGDVSTAEQSMVAVSAYRFANQSDQLGYFARWVPDQYPHYGYSSYVNLPRVLLPRALDPSKPTWDSNEIGRRYEILQPFDFVTAVNPSPSAEAYVAGGPRFMVIVAASMGVFLVGLGYVMRSRRSAVLVTGSLMASHVLMAVESGVLSLFLTIPFGLVLYPVMRWACVERNHRPAQASTS